MVITIKIEKIPNESLILGCTKVYLQIKFSFRYTNKRSLYVEVYISSYDVINYIVIEITFSSAVYIVTFILIIWLKLLTCF